MQSICLSCGGFIETSPRYPRKTCSIRCRKILSRSKKKPVTPHVTPTEIPQTVVTPPVESVELPIELNKILPGLINDPDWFKEYRNKSAPKVIVKEPEEPKEELTYSQDA